MKTENVWSFHYKNVDTEGNVNEIYRCNKVKYKGEQCKAGVYLNYPSTNNDAILYRSQLAHNCNEIATKVKGSMSKEVKIEIKALFDFDSKIKPKKIIEILTNKQMALPKKTDLNNYLVSLKKFKYGSTSISLGELERFFIDNSQAPEDPDEAFIVSYQIEYEEPTFFRFFISSKTLLKLSINAKHIHTDATYKLIWQGFPVLILGTTDRNRMFHTFGVAVCTNEQTEDFIFLFNALKSGVEKIFIETIGPSSLVCDASKSIQNAFKHVFGSETTIHMCWAHMKKNVQKKAEQLVRPKENIFQILEDIDILQLSQNEEIFEKASCMFVVKWEKQNDFIKYFQKEWLELNRNWFEGVQKLVPSTNNALEAFNRVLKDENTLRERLPISRFSVILKEYIRSWSLQYTTKAKEVHLNSVVDLKLWTTSYQWARQQKKITSNITANGHTYTVPSKDAPEVSSSDLTKNMNLDFHSFNDFKTIMFKIWRTTIPEDPDKWIQGECNCPAFFKKQICKHVVGIAIRLKYAIPPPEAKAIPIGAKRRRGRPSKSKRALLVQ